MADSMVTAFEIHTTHRLYFELQVVLQLDLGYPRLKGGQGMQYNIFHGFSLPSTKFPNVSPNLSVSQRFLTSLLNNIRINCDVFKKNGRHVSLTRIRQHS